MPAQSLSDGAKQQLLHVDAGADRDFVFAELHAPPIFAVEAEHRAIHAFVS